jgi:RNA polymerase sigma-70 factor, ECF subfamily
MGRDAALREVSGSRRRSAGSRLCAGAPEQVRAAEMARLHLPVLLRSALVRTGELSDAWDLVQDTFERALRRPPAVTSQGELRSWLLVVLRNRSLDYHRAAIVRRSEPVDPNTLAAPGPKDDPLWSRIDGDIVSTLIPLLSVALREVFVMHMEGCSSGEIARRLAIPIATVGTRIHRARRRLRAIVEQSAESDDSTRAAS